MTDNQPPIEREEEHDILFGIINRFIGYFTQEAVPKTINDTRYEYPFVAMDTRQAYEQLLLARSFLTRSESGKRPRFIDIGCGIGNILLLAEMMDLDIFGIEKDTASQTVASRLLGDNIVSRENIWEYTGIGTFDIVYYFRPFCKKDLQLKFEARVESEMNPGSVLIANRKMNMAIDDNPSFQRIDDNLPVWYKKS